MPTACAPISSVSPDHADRRAARHQPTIAFLIRDHRPDGVPSRSGGGTQGGMDGIGMDHATAMRRVPTTASAVGAT